MFPSVHWVVSHWLQFVQNNLVVFSHTFTTPQYANELFNPGEYELRILFDKNKNGIWDAGEFFGKHLQPELIKPIERKITYETEENYECSRNRVIDSTYSCFFGRR